MQNNVTLVLEPRLGWPTAGLVDIHVAGAHIAAILAPDTDSSGHGRAGRGRDLSIARGALVTPSFVEGHIHLDKTLLGLPFVPHRAGPYGRGPDRGGERACGANPEAAGRSNGAAGSSSRSCCFGTGALRSHVDIDTELKLDGLHALLDLKTPLCRSSSTSKSWPFRRAASCATPARPICVDAAIRAGADLVGGLDPAGIDGDVTGHLDAIFGIADAPRGRASTSTCTIPARSGPSSCATSRAARCAAGLEGRVAVSHAFALGAIDDGGVRPHGRGPRARPRVAIMTNGPGDVPMPPVKRLASAGVTVFAGSDNIRDAWSPFGNGDMLGRAMMIGYRQGFRSDADLEHAFAMATVLPAGVLRLDGYGLSPGGRADLVVIPAGSVAEAVAGQPMRRSTIKSGRIVVRHGELCRA